MAIFLVGPALLALQIFLKPESWVQFHNCGHIISKDGQVGKFTILQNKIVIVERFDMKRICIPPFNRKLTGGWNFQQIMSFHC